MPPIKNWSRFVTNNVADLKNTLGGEGTVRMWRHVGGDTVSVELWRSEIQSMPQWYYAIVVNGEAVEAEQTLNTAIDSLVRFMRDFPDGIPD